MEQDKWLTLNTGRKVPRMLYGTAWKDESTADLVCEALKSGFRGIDSAAQPKHYREDLVGNAIEEFLKENDGISRGDLFIETKFTPIYSQESGTEPYNKELSIPKQIEQSIENSLRSLKIEYLDCYLLHSEFPEYPDTLTAWRTLIELRKRGLTKDIGVSNIRFEALKSLYKDTGVAPAVVQNRLYKSTFYDYELRRWAKANSIVYQSFWTLTANLTLAKHPEIQSLARKLNVSWQQAWYLFVMKSGICVLNGTSNPTNMKSDVLLIDRLGQVEPLCDKILGFSS